MFGALFKTVAFINRHPLVRHSGGGVARFMRFQLGSRFLPYDIAVPFVGETRLLIKRGMTGATGNFYCGLHEFEEMGFLLHVLRDTDRFADVGANIGSYTLLAAGVCGAETWCFEPCRGTFERLCDNMRLNNLADTVHALNMAVGAEKGVLAFTEGNDTMNHIVRTGSGESGSPVTVDTLDAQLAATPPQVLKIDVEGYETEVVKGAAAVLSADACKAVIMEVGEGGRYGFDEQALHRNLLTRGFAPYRYDPFKRKLHPTNQTVTQNNLFIRDIDWVMKRLNTAPLFRINGVAI